MNGTDHRFDRQNTGCFRAKSASAVSSVLADLAFEIMTYRVTRVQFAAWLAMEGRMRRFACWALRYLPGGTALLDMISSAGLLIFSRTS